MNKSSDKKRIMMLGLTGSTGAGKSALGEVFAEYGCSVIDCDVLARRAVEPGMPALGQLAARFGGDIIRADGTLDRALLAERAFPTAEGRERLNAIVHPAVFELIAERVAELESQGVRGAVIDAPLLFESGLQEECDAVIAVTAPDETRLKRIMKRDGISEEAARLRMSAQPPCGFYSERADYTIVNDGDLAQLYAAARRVLDGVFGGEQTQ